MLPDLRYGLAVFCCEDVHTVLFVTESEIYISSYYVKRREWQIISKPAFFFKYYRICWYSSQEKWFCFSFTGFVISATGVFLRNCY